MLNKEKSVCEEHVFKTIFKNHYDVVRNYIYYKCQDTDLANDLAQNAFVKLWENCKKVNANESLYYLKRLTYNLFLNHWKHEKIVTNYKNTEAEVKKNFVFETPQFVLEEKEFASKLEKAISNLKDKQKEVFLMHRIDQMSYKEIAEFLDISVKAVEKRMHLALKSLRDEIKGI